MSSIVVAVKAVPLGSPPARIADGRWVAPAEWRLDPINELTVAWATEIRAAGAVTAVHAVSVGAPAVTEIALRAALARGCDSAAAVTVDEGVELDVPSTARLLAAAAREHDDVRLLALGYESFDGSSGALPAAVAGILGWPLAGRARNARLTGTELAATCSTGAAAEVVTLPLPAVVTFVEGDVVARSPRLQAVLRTRTAPIATTPAAVLAGVPLTSWTDGLAAVEPTPLRRREPLVLDDAAAGTDELAARIAAVRAPQGATP